MATEADYCATAQTQPHPRSFARNNRLHCVGPDHLKCGIPGEGRGQGPCVCGAVDHKEDRIGGRLFWQKEKAVQQGWGPNGNPPLPNHHPLIFSLYLLALALPRPPQPTPGWANRCSALQALSQVSADLAAPRNGPRRPAAERTLPHSALLTAPRAPLSLR